MKKVIRAKSCLLALSILGISMSATALLYPVPTVYAAEITTETTPETEPEQPDPDSEDTPTEEIKLNKQTASVKIGKSVKLSLQGTDAKVKWSSGNKKIATVSENGVVKGKCEGSTKIKATADGETYICQITVTSNLTSDQQKLLKSVEKAFKDEDYYKLSSLAQRKSTIQMVKKMKGTRYIYYTNDKKTKAVMLCKPTNKDQDVLFYYGNVKYDERSGKGLFFLGLKENGSLGYRTVKGTFSEDNLNGKIVIQTANPDGFYFDMTGKAKNGVMDGKVAIQYSIPWYDENGVEAELRKVTLYAKCKNGYFQKASMPKSKGWQKFFAEEGGYSKWYKSQKKGNKKTWEIVAYGSEKNVNMIGYRFWFFVKTDARFEYR